MRKIYFLISVLLSVLCLQRIDAQNNIIDGVVWVVGDDAILKSDVEQMRLQMQQENATINGDPYCFIPEQLAIQKLYLHQAKLDSIEPQETSVTMQLESEINRAIEWYGSRERLEEILGPLNTYRETAREMLRERSIIEQVQRNIIKDVKLTPSDVRSFYNRIPKDSLPFIPTSVEVQIITFEPQPTLQEIDAIKQQLRDYSDRITRGEVQFSTLATINSDDAETARRGGQTGFMAKSMLQSEYAAVAFDLNDPTKVSRIIESEEGFYYILQLIEKRGDRINVRQIQKRPKITQEELDKAKNAIDSLRNFIVEGKTTFEDAAIYSSDKNSRMNKGIMVNTKTEGESTLRYGTSHFEMSELPPEIGKIVNEMQVGDISKPFIMVNDKQKQEVAIVKLKSRVERHKASISEDFQALKEIALQQKQEDTLNRWIAKKQKETYIRIADGWKNCDFEKDGWVVQ